MTTFSPLSAGEPAPWFSAVTGSNSSDATIFDELGGRHIILFFFGAATRPDVAEVLESLGSRNDLFDGERSLFVGISNDAEDFDRGRTRQNTPGQFFLLDRNGVITRQYVSEMSEAGADFKTIHPVAFVVSPSLQIIEIMQLGEPRTFAAQIVSRLGELLVHPPGVQNAPVLIVPRIFDRSFCDELIKLHEAVGGREIGSIESEGKIVEQFDPKFRKRLDWYINDQPTVQRIRELLERRLLPMVYRAFQFRTTRIERYLVGCYDAERGGYFRPHRDNTAPLVAHRRFAVTINLNEGYDGGHLCFPEFGQTYRTSPGDAIVFSCSVLHEATPVTRKRRYAFLSFFYDEQSQQLRDEYRQRWIESQKSRES